MGEASCLIRALTLADEPFLWEMLYQALFILPGAEPFPPEVTRQPEISRYVEGWGRAGDSGFIAICENSQQPIGAVWVRLMNGDNKGYGYVDDETPELTIAIAPEFRGKGIGSELVSRQLADTKLHHRAVCLSVSADNPALRLYKKLRFETVKTDGTSLTMIKRFD